MDPFVGEIKMVAFNYAPQNWALCDGSLLPIQQYTALFSLLGTFYGGNGQTNFALPDLRGRVPVHQGSGPNLSPYAIGQSAGTETVTLNVQQMPSHNHTFTADGSPGQTVNPSGATLAQVQTANDDNPSPSFNTGAPGTPAQLDNGSISMQGGTQPHANIQPYLAVNFIIALQGIYPPRQ